MRKPAMASMAAESINLFFAILANPLHLGGQTPAAAPNVNMSIRLLRTDGQRGAPLSQTGGQATSVVTVIAPAKPHANLHATVINFFPL